MRIQPTLLLCVTALLWASPTHAQQQGEWPEAPAPTVEVAATQDAARADRQSQREKAAAQVKEQERQRVLGILPNFGTSYRSDAVSLTAAQKIGLAFRSAVDPAAFGTAVLVAGYHEANDDYSGFGWGAQGFGKRAGAAYLDAFNGTMIGNGFLPALLHQDPRFFRLGHGTKKHRLLYAMATTVMCKHDNTGRWEPNYSNISGNIIAGAISNLYYPNENSGWGETIDNGMIVTIEGTGGAVFQEFWPDISRKFFHKDPTHGLDEEMRAKDAEQKAAHEKSKQKQPLPPAPK